MTSPSPLSKSELTALQEAADRRGMYSEQLLVNIVPYTGLYPGEFTHFRKSWIRWGDSDEPVFIDVPMTAACSPLIMTSHSNVGTRTGPCTYCQNHGETNGWEAPFPHRNRSIPVQDPHATNQLKWWFKFYDVIPVHGHMNRKLDKVIQESSISRTVDFRDLRLTFIRILAAMGFDLDLIKEWSGYVDLKKEIRAILHRSPNQYRHHKIRPTSFLKALYHGGPMTVSQLEDEVGQTANIHRMLYQLLDRSIVEKVGTRPNSNSGVNPTLWDCTTLPTSFDCLDCDQQFDSLRGLNIHSGHVHG